MDEEHLLTELQKHISALKSALELTHCFVVKNQIAVSDPISSICLHDYPKNNLYI